MTWKSDKCGNPTRPGCESFLMHRDLITSFLISDPRNLWRALWSVMSETNLYWWSEHVARSNSTCYLIQSGPRRAGDWKRSN